MLQTLFTVVKLAIIIVGIMVIINVVSDIYRFAAGPSSMYAGGGGAQFAPAAHAGAFRAAAPFGAPNRPPAFAWPGPVANPILASSTGAAVVIYP